MTRKTVSLFAVIFVVGLGSGAAEDFPETRLREGREAYRAHSPADAIDPLRIAAFGLLGRPALLCEALVYLALANEASGLHADAQSTLQRLSDVQRRAPACGEAKLDQAVRSEFESRFNRRLPAVSAPPAPAPAPPRAAPSLQPRDLAPPTPAPAPPKATPSLPPRDLAPPTLAPAPPKPTPSLPPRDSAPPAPALATPKLTPPPRPNEAGSATDIVETPVRIKKSVPPVYPRAAREAGAGGTVVLRVLVSEKGRAMQVEVERGPRPDLADAAVVAMQYWTFEPARKNGREIAAWTTIEIPFKP